MMLKSGGVFPEFSLPNQDGSVVTLEDLKGGKSIVYFYPKDDTPGCTAEACSFNEALPDFAGAMVYGISPDAPSSHRAFADKYGIRFTLLADEEHRLADAVGAWGEKERNGQKTWGILRTTFLLDDNAVVLHVWEDVTPQDHAKEILAWL